MPCENVTLDDPRPALACSSGASKNQTCDLSITSEPGFASVGPVGSLIVSIPQAISPSCPRRQDRMVSRETYWDVIVGPRNGFLSQSPISLHALGCATLSPLPDTLSARCSFFARVWRPTRLVKFLGSAMVVR